MMSELARRLEHGWFLIEAGNPQVLREACLKDLFFFIRFACNRADIEHEWLLERCDEVQNDPNGHLDLWARDHYKSTIITFGLTLQDILRDPELTVCIFSHTRPIAKAFLRQIKRELENNAALKAWFPDVLWDEPHKQAPSWSEDNGLCLRRRSNPTSNTLEAWGLVDGQPTGKHFQLRVYDDVVTRENVTTQDMRATTVEAWELSLSIGTKDGISRYIGTRYHYADCWATMMRRGTVEPRIRACIDAAGDPVLLTKEQMRVKRRDMGMVTWAAQMMLDPLAESSICFFREWLRYYRDPRGQRGNVYILVDPANAKKKRSDYTAVWVVCLSSDQNYYVLDIVRDRINLQERCELIFGLHRFWKPIKVVYEEYGINTDRQTLTMMMEQKGYRFETVSVGGKIGKTERIQGLSPLFEANRIYFPDSLIRTPRESGRPENMVQTFVEQEYACWPFCEHDDMLDCLARMLDPKAGLEWPMDDEPDAWSEFRAEVKVALGTGQVAGF